MEAAPNEIILEILNNVEGGEFDTPNGRRFAASFSLVCRRFHEIIHPKLYSHLRIHYSCFASPIESQKYNTFCKYATQVRSLGIVISNRRMRFDDPAVFCGIASPAELIRPFATITNLLIMDVRWEETLSTKLTQLASMIFSKANLRQLNISLVGNRLVTPLDVSEALREIGKHATAPSITTLAISIQSGLWTSNQELMITHDCVKQLLDRITPFVKDFHIWFRLSGLGDSSGEDGGIPGMGNSKWHFEKLETLVVRAAGSPISPAKLVTNSTAGKIKNLTLLGSLSFDGIVKLDPEFARFSNVRSLWIGIQADPIIPWSFMTRVWNSHESKAQRHYAPLASEMKSLKAFTLFSSQCNASDYPLTKSSTNPKAHTVYEIIRLCRYNFAVNRDGPVATLTRESAPSDSRFERCKAEELPRDWKRYFFELEWLQPV